MEDGVVDSSEEAGVAPAGGVFYILPHLHIVHKQYQHAAADCVKQQH